MALFAIKTGVEQLGLALSDHAIHSLENYLILLGKWNKTYNLTAVRDERQMISHHILDSLSIAPYFLKGERLLDVGSGGGMPGIPLAIVRPDWHVVLLDANHKKTTFLRQAVIELGLLNVTVATDRVEHYQVSFPFDWIVSRAFSDLAEFMRLSQHLLKKNGQFMAMKGVVPFEEMASLPGTMCSEVIPIKVPGLQAKRHLIRIQLR